MSAIQEDMRQLDKIVSELKVINAKAKELRSMKKELEAKILEYLETTSTPGLKLNDLIVVRAESTTHQKLKKKEKQDAIITALEENGINEPETVYKTIIQAMTGEKQSQYKLKVSTAKPEFVVKLT